ncbi:DUF6056 family protein [Butyrivibrio sp. DSM 10294]|uniref:DUF3329 domain-containing protein n=1 Tax=Butyrivibrio sp. DSM 10294 TaxID=2972457 RepID=UPI00234F6734|nr:DUF6056 family protein [Butyrivibrio sp. DSM 10294]MDC7292988.1 DUF6056 family protein [Butyrivibrio sp. DSM 10294]
MTQNVRKTLFYILIFVTFMGVMIYEFLTPYMSDDIVYGDAVAGAGNFFDLFSQEYAHYIDHTGRSVAHFMLRVFLFTGAKAVFNVGAAAAFTGLALLVYSNVSGKKESDERLFALIILMFWLLDPAISNTVFWESGACNYLFTTTIIMGYLTLYRKKPGSNIPWTIGMFVLGVLAGWCNENTSGGLILFELILVGYMYFHEKKSLSFLTAPMVSGFVGTVAGFVMLLLSPGNYGRLDILEEEHTGLMALAARFLKITLNIKNNYLVLVIALILGLVVIFYLSEDVKEFWEKSKSIIMFGVLFVATCYALIMVPSSELRSYYGASIFLMTGVCQAVVTTMELLISKSRESVIKKLSESAYTGLVMCGLIFLVLTYIEDGANLARIKREFDERDAYLQQMADAGEVDVYAPKLRPEWDNRFSMAYVSDIEADYHYWINTFYASHFHLDTVSGVEREDWTEY